MGVLVFLILVVMQFGFLTLVITLLLPRVCHFINWWTDKQQTRTQAATEKEFNVRIKPVEETGSPYQPPAVTGAMTQTELAANIPIPGFGKSVAVAMASLLMIAGMQILVLFFASAASWIGLLSFGAAVFLAFLGTAGFLALVLPTTIGRAFVVSGLTMFSSYFLNICLIAIFGFLLYLGTVM